MSSYTIFLKLWRMPAFSHIWVGEKALLWSLSPSPSLSFSLSSSQGQGTCIQESHNLRKQSIRILFHLVFSYLILIVLQWGNWETSRFYCFNNKNIQNIYNFWIVYNFIIEAMQLICVVITSPNFYLLPWGILTSHFPAMETTGKNPFVRLILLPEFIRREIWGVPSTDETLDSILCRGTHFLLGSAEPFPGPPTL